MIVLRSPADVAAIKHPGIHRLIRERLSEMKLDEPFDQFGELILVESGDNPGSIESSSGCWITTGLFSDENFGSPDSCPALSGWNITPKLSAGKCCSSCPTTDSAPCCLCRIHPISIPTCWRSTGNTPPSSSPSICNANDAL